MEAYPRESFNFKLEKNKTMSISYINLKRKKIMTMVGMFLKKIRTLIPTIASKTRSSSGKDQ
jgi:hypothetical protein